MTTFADLKLGDVFDLSSEDDDDLTKTRGSVVSIIKYDDGTVLVHFDDELGTSTWGRLTDPVHNFMEKIA